MSGHALYLALGGNIGDTLDVLARARDLIARRIGEPRSVSCLYRTEPWGHPRQAWFTNQVVVVGTTLTPHEALERCREIELELGRSRGEERYGPRVIDVDLLLYDDVVLDSEDLTLPHARLHERRFVLEPLSEVASRLRHPRLGRTISELLEACEDRSSVSRLEQPG